MREKIGAVMNIHLPGFNLYAGLDSFLPLLTSKEHLPVGSLNTNLTLGLTFTFGKAKRHLCDDLYKEWRYVFVFFQFPYLRSDALINVSSVPQS